MDIIPVIDLKGGLVVHARRGQRHSYQPLASGLCAGARPERVAAALIERFSPRTLYIADLDALEGIGNHLQQVSELSASYGHVAIWLDAGFKTPEQLARIAAQTRTVPVIGTEVLADMHAYRRLRDTVADMILSLDFLGETLRGPVQLLHRPDLWPERIIHLDLERVGAMQGPDTAAIKRYSALAPDRQIYAGGGIRGVHDLDALAKAGARGALVATALHDATAATEIAAYQEISVP